MCPFVYFRRESHTGTKDRSFVLKKNTVRIILAVLSGLILIGGGLTAFIFDSQYRYDNILVEVEDGMNETVEFEHLSLIPGEEAVYTVSFSSRLTEKYILYLDFSEETDQGLKNYVHLKIEVGGEVLSDKLLSEYLFDDPMELELELMKKERTPVKFIYYLPIEVGNEAQCTEAIFKLQITAKHLRGENEH